MKLESMKLCLTCKSNSGKSDRRGRSPHHILSGAIVPVQRKFGSGCVFMICGLLLLASAPVAVCQTASGDETESTSPPEIEEILVYGKSLVSLRNAIYRAEDAVFEIFNQLNSDDKYDVHCGYETTTESRIKRRFCRSEFEARMLSEAGGAFLRGEGSSHMPNWARVMQNNDELLEEMKTLRVTHPQLREALDRVTEAKEIFQSQKKEKSSD